jgi:protein SCO1/2
MIRLFFICISLCAEQRFAVTGLVISADPAKHIVEISHEAIPRYMPAMAMPFHVEDRSEVGHLKPGMRVSFTLVVGEQSSYIVDVREKPYNSQERDPDQARRLAVLDSALRGKRSEIAVGATVPDFSLTDQNRRAITIRQFRGKVVVVTFIYTRCPLPDYCLRLTNNFGKVQKRFQERMNKDLVLLSVSFDPDHDTPEVLAKYAASTNSVAEGWHFLTGARPAIREVCNEFGMNFWPDEGLFTHSLHTVLIDRDGRLIVNVEGNQFNASQLGDLIESALAK